MLATSGTHNDLSDIWKETTKPAWDRGQVEDILSPNNIFWKVEFFWILRVALII